ncbi:MAG: imidazolonepropionase [Pseudomonadota bacterium]
MPLLTNIRTLYRVPRDGGQGQVDAIDHAVLAWDQDHITYAGPADECPDEFDDGERINAGGRCAIPGLIDCHTHLSFGGWRSREFSQRLAGESYQSIQAAGGGIASTLIRTRQASTEMLINKAMLALEEMTNLGVTTVEAKSGYGLNREDELKQLEVYRELNHLQALELVPTCLAAHLVPPEYAERREAYLDLLCNELIPEIAERKLARFFDVFIEEGAFSLAEARRVLNRAKELGLGLKIHADQLSAGSGADLAAELGAVSAEHLEYASDEGRQAMAAAGTVAVTLPIASLYLRERYVDARKWIEAGVPVAVATDFNPGSAPSLHLPLALLLACLNQHMTPSEALKGATAMAARAIGLQDSHGSLLPGYQADVAIIDAPDIEHWLYHFRPNACVATIKRGEFIHRTPAI